MGDVERTPAPDEEFEYDPSVDLDRTFANISERLDVRGATLLDLKPDQIKDLLPKASEWKKSKGKPFPVDIIGTDIAITPGDNPSANLEVTAKKGTEIKASATIDNSGPDGQIFAKDLKAPFLVKGLVNRQLGENGLREKLEEFFLEGLGDSRKNTNVRISLSDHGTLTVALKDPDHNLSLASVDFAAAATPVATLFQSASEDQGNIPLQGSVDVDANTSQPDLNETDGSPESAVQQHEQEGALPDSGAVPGGTKNEDEEVQELLRRLLADNDDTTHVVTEPNLGDNNGKVTEIPMNKETAETPIDVTRLRGQNANEMAGNASDLLKDGKPVVVDIEGDGPAFLARKFFGSKEIREALSEKGEKINFKGGEAKAEYGFEGDPDILFIRLGGKLEGAESPKDVNFTIGLRNTVAGLEIFTTHCDDEHLQGLLDKDKDEKGADRMVENAFYYSMPRDKEGKDGRRIIRPKMNFRITGNSLEISLQPGEPKSEIPEAAHTVEEHLVVETPPSPEPVAAPVDETPKTLLDDYIGRAAKSRSNYEEAVEEYKLATKRLQEHVGRKVPRGPSLDEQQRRYAHLLDVAMREYEADLRKMNFEVWNSLSWVGPQASNPSREPIKELGSEIREKLDKYKESVLSGNLEESIKTFDDYASTIYQRLDVYKNLKSKGNENEVETPRVVVKPHLEEVTVPDAASEEEGKKEENTIVLKTPPKGARNIRVLKVDFYNRSDSEKIDEVTPGNEKYELFDRTSYILFWRTKKGMFATTVNDLGERTPDAKTYFEPLTVKSKSGKRKGAPDSELAKRFDKRVDYVYNRYRAALNAVPTEMDVEVAKVEEDKTPKTTEAESEKTVEEAVQGGTLINDPDSSIDDVHGAEEKKPSLPDDVRSSFGQILNTEVAKLEPNQRKEMLNRSFELFDILRKLRLGGGLNPTDSEALDYFENMIDEAQKDNNLDLGSMIWVLKQYSSALGVEA